MEMKITGEIIEASSYFGGAKETVRTFTGTLTTPVERESKDDHLSAGWDSVD